MRCEVEMLKMLIEYGMDGNKKVPNNCVKHVQDEL
jgi:hypothetical protein